VEAGYLAVARVSKPHGLKGEVVVFVLTDQPERVFVAGRQLTPLDEAGRAVGPALTLERARPFHRRWLLKFTELGERTAVESWRTVVLGAVAAELDDPGGDEMYAHEVPGAMVMVRGRAVGAARELIPVPGGHLLALEVEGREVLVPFRRPILVRVDRERREIEIDPPAGLLEL
jgi:16S rRNA processing protein RimM